MVHGSTIDGLEYVITVSDNTVPLTQLQTLHVHTCCIITCRCSPSCACTAYCCQHIRFYSDKPHTGHATMTNNKSWYQQDWLFYYLTVRLCQCCFDLCEHGTQQHTVCISSLPHFANNHYLFTPTPQTGSAWTYHPLTFGIDYMPSGTVRH